MQVDQARDVLQRVLNLSPAPQRAASMRSWVEAPPSDPTAPVPSPFPTPGDQTGPPSDDEVRCRPGEMTRGTRALTPPRAPRHCRHRASRSYYRSYCC